MPRRDYSAELRGSIMNFLLTTPVIIGLKYKEGKGRFIYAGKLDQLYAL